MTNRDDYTSFVADEAAGRCDPDHPTWDLRAEPERWYRALVEVLEDVNAHLSGLSGAEAEIKGLGLGRDEFFTRISEVKARRAGAVHFKRKVERRLREVKALVADGKTARAQVEMQWKRLATWLIDQFAEDEWPELEAEAPPELAPALAHAIAHLRREPANA